MNLYRPANGCGRSLRHSEPPDFTGVHQLPHGADGVFDGNLRIHPVLVIQINDINSQPQQAAIAGGLDVLGVAAHTDELALGIAHIAKLGCEKYFSPAAFDGLADELFILAAAIHVSGIQKVESEIEGAVDGDSGFNVVLRSVKVRHPHAAEAEGGNLWAIFAKRSCFHRGQPFWNGLVVIIAQRQRCAACVALLLFGHVPRDPACRHGCLFCFG